MADAATGGLWQNRNFRRLFGASAVSNLGDGVAAMAYPWLATLLTRDPLLVSMVAVAGRLPWVLIALPAGVWTDRADRLKLMIGANLVQTVLTLVVAGLVVGLSVLPLGAAPVLILSALVFLLGVAEVLRDNSAQTFLPAVVPGRDLEQANGRVWAAEQVVNQFAGPPLGGVLIGLALWAPFAFDALSFAGAAVLLAGIRVPRPVPPPPRGFWAELREGFAWLKDQVLIRRLAVALGLTNMVFSAAIAMMALYAQEVLGLGAFGYGVLLMSGAAGGVLAGLAGPLIVRRIGPGPTVHLAMTIFALSYLLIGLVPMRWAAALGLFGDAFGGILWNVVTVSWRQRVIPATLLGRVNAIYRFVGWGMIPVGSALGGLTVRLAEAPLGREQALMLPFLLAGVATILLTLWGLGALRFPEPGTRE